MKRCAFVLAMLVSRIAVSAPPRVVLADGDPELLRAIETSLRPWHFVIVIDPETPGGPEAAKQRAEQDGARFVVWRDRDELVVFDHETGLAERRPAQTGALDPTVAAAAALTVKTMMRLPPPSQVQADVAVIATAPAVAAPGPELRLEVGTGARFEASDTAARVGLAAMLQPWHGSCWWFGVLGDLGTSDSITQASFKGDWQTWDVLAAARYAIELGHTAWTIEPQLAAGLEHSELDGTEQMMTPRFETALLLALRAGAAARYQLGRWSFAGVVEVEERPFTRTYTKTDSSAEIFEIPALGVGAGILVGTDLGL